MKNQSNNLKVAPRYSFFTPLVFTPLHCPSHIELELTVWPIECGGSMFLPRLDHERHFCFSLDLLNHTSQGKPATMLEGRSIALWRNPCRRQQKTLLTAVPICQTHKWATEPSQSSLQMAPQPLSDSSFIRYPEWELPSWYFWIPDPQSHYHSFTCLILGVLHSSWWLIISNGYMSLSVT